MTNTLSVLFFQIFHISLDFNCLRTFNRITRPEPGKFRPHHAIVFYNIVKKLYENSKLSLDFLPNELISYKYYIGTICEFNFFKTFLAAKT